MTFSSLLVYIFFDLLAFTARANRNKSQKLFYLLLFTSLSFPRYVFSVLLELFVRLDFAVSSPVCPRFVVWKRFPSWYKTWYKRVGISVLAIFRLCTHEDGHVRTSFVVSIHLSFRSFTSDKSRIQMKSLKPLPKFFQLFWRKPNQCQSFSSPVFLFLHTVCCAFPRRHASYD